MKKIFQMEPWAGREEEREIIKVLRSGWFTEAGKTREFEKKVADFVGSKYSLAVSNGTVSLFVALLSLGVGENDEVIVPDFTMIASPNAILLAGAKPVFVVEDAAQALGSFYMGKHLGTFGDVGSFSFSTPKVITTGQGGILVTNDKKAIRKDEKDKRFWQKKKRDRRIRDARLQL